MLQEPVQQQVRVECHIVYKRCLRLLKRYWTILKVIWRMGKVAQQWRHAEGVWILKEEISSTIEQFRATSHLSVEGKIFFHIVAWHMTEVLLRNTYIDTAMQKDGIPGCIGKGDLAGLWLDLAKAYESIPYKLKENWLEQHHVPGKIRDFILYYYSCLSLMESNIYI